MDIRVAGIDYSMTSPAVCFYAGNSFSFEECQFLVMTDVEPKVIHPNIQFIPHPEWKTEIERFTNIANVFHNFIKEHDPDYIGIEGYSMNSRGMVFNIGENTGILKYKLYSDYYSFDTIPPTTIKKFATKSGRADKKLMVETFNQTNSINLGQSIFKNPDKVTSPISDLIDAYYITKYIFDKYK